MKSRALFANNVIGEQERTRGWQATRLLPSTNILSHIGKKKTQTRDKCAMHLTARLALFRCLSSFHIERGGRKNLPAPCCAVRGVLAEKLLSRHVSHIAISRAISVADDCMPLLWFGVNISMSM